MGNFAKSFTEGFGQGLSIAQRREAMDLRRQQMESLEEHRAYARDLQAKQLEVQQRQGDLLVVDRLRQVLTDQNLHPEAKGLLLDDLARMLNHDPKGERFKDLKRALVKMPSDQAAALSRSMVMAFPNLKPGEVSQFVSGLISGGVSIADVPKLVGEMSQRSAAQEGFSPQGFSAVSQAAPEAASQDFNSFEVGDVFPESTDVPGTQLSTASPQLQGQLEKMREGLGEPPGSQTLGEIFGATPISRPSRPKVQSAAPIEQPTIEQPDNGTELSAADWRRRAVRFFQQGMTQEGNSALQMANQVQPRARNTVERIREKIAAGQELTAGEQRVYDDALKADPLARLLSTLGGGSQSQTTPPADNTQPEPSFKSAEEVEAAVAAGRVKIGDTVIVNGQRVRVSQ